MIRQIGLILIAGLHSPAAAQMLVRGSIGDADVRSLEDKSAGPSLSCEVEPVKPTLNYALRLQAAYVVNVPMKQLSGDGHKLNLIVRITPERKPPVYLTDAIELPPVPETKSSYQVKGRYILGEGRYSATLILQDERGRSCRKAWQINATARRRVGRFPMELPPGGVEEVSWRGAAPRQPHQDASNTVHLTLLLHAAPRGHSKGAASVLTLDDQEQMLGAISAVRQQFAKAVIRVVLFSLDKRKEILRREDIGPGALGQVADMLKQLKLGTVDYRALQNPQGNVDLLADLIRHEIRSNHPPNAVIFIGERQRYASKIGPFEQLSAGAPPFFYLLYTSRTILPLPEPSSDSSPDEEDAEVSMWQPDVPNIPLSKPESSLVFMESDIISRVVEKVNGKMIAIRSPFDLVKALADVSRRIGSPNLQP